MRPQSLLYARLDWEHRRKLIGYMVPTRDETQGQMGDGTDVADVAWPTVTMEMFEGSFMMLLGSYDCRNAVTDIK